VASDRTRLSLSPLPPSTRYLRGQDHPLYHDAPLCFSFPPKQRQSCLFPSPETSSATTALSDIVRRRSSRYASRLLKAPQSGPSPQNLETQSLNLSAMSLITRAHRRSRKRHQLVYVPVKPYSRCRSARSAARTSAGHGCTRSACRAPRSTRSTSAGSPSTREHAARRPAHLRPPARPARGAQLFIDAEGNKRPVVKGPRDHCRTSSIERTGSQISPRVVTPRYTHGRLPASASCWRAYAAGYTPYSGSARSRRRCTTTMS
jgi:hypothetical protein